MTAVLFGVALMVGGVWAFVFLARSDRRLAESCRPSTGDPVWDAFYAETAEIPVHDGLLP